LISRYRTILDSPHVYAGVLLVLIMTTAFSFLIRWVERKAAVWPGSRTGQNVVFRETPAGEIQMA
jgi:NitT/TauT family transport system permease protein/taurine transport system permease protein